MGCPDNQKPEQQFPKIAVLGIGNLLLKDEGAGIHLLRLLRETNSEYTNVELIDAGTSVDIPIFVDKVDKLIILDAVNGGGEPGTIYHFELKDTDTKWDVPLSFHQFGILDNLKVMTLLGKKPKSIVIIGIEPKLVDWGIELSPEIESKLPQVLKLIEEEINQTTNLIKGDENDSL